jgi:hypothetical protein
VDYITKLSRAGLYSVDGRMNDELKGTGRKRQWSEVLSLILSEGTE